METEEKIVVLRLRDGLIEKIFHNVEGLKVCVLDYDVDPSDLATNISIMDDGVSVDPAYSTVDGSPFNFNPKKVEELYSQISTDIFDVIREFIETYGKQVQDNETSSYVELMMDDHFCVEFEDSQYYVPENSSLYSQHDEVIVELLRDRFAL